MLSAFFSMCYLKTKSQWKRDLEEPNPLEAIGLSLGHPRREKIGRNMGLWDRQTGSTHRSLPGATVERRSQSPGPSLVSPGKFFTQCGFLFLFFTFSTPVSMVISSKSITSKTVKAERYL